MSLPEPPWREPFRLDRIGAGVERTLTADAPTRERIRAHLDLASLDSLSADLQVRPYGPGWRLSGRLTAKLAQTCGITLEPLPVTLDETFTVDLVDAAQAPRADHIEIEVSLEDDAPDIVEDGAIDLAAYVVEQLGLSLDPFPRKPGVEFTPPEGPAEPSPFAVLTRLKPRDNAKG